MLYCAWVGVKRKKFSFCCSRHCVCRARARPTDRGSEKDGPRSAPLDCSFTPHARDVPAAEGSGLQSHAIMKLRQLSPPRPKSERRPTAGHICDSVTLKRIIEKKNSVLESSRTSQIHLIYLAMFCPNLFTTRL